MPITRYWSFQDLNVIECVYTSFQNFGVSKIHILKKLIFLFSKDVFNLSKGTVKAFLDGFNSNNINKRYCTKYTKECYLNAVCLFFVVVVFLLSIHQKIKDHGFHKNIMHATLFKIMAIRRKILRAKSE